MSISWDVADKVIMVTGGGSGIGAATGKLLHNRGARVVAVDISAERLADTFGGIDRRDVLTVEADVAQESGAHRMVEECRTHFGRLDGIVAGAGISSGGTVESTTPDAWDRIILGNLRSVFLTAHFGIPLMKEAAGGSFVAVGSQLSLVGARNSAAYCASKGGVASLTRAMSLDHADAAIRVNTVCPGPTVTPMFEGAGMTEEQLGDLIARVPLARAAEADEIASVIGFLLSDAASFVTGATWTVDGGYTAA